MRKSLLYVLFLLLAGSLSGQDLHYSQFYNSPLNVNPAKTGIFNGDKRVNLSYRSQWRSVPVPWTTFSGSFDRKFYPEHGKQHFFSVGLLFNYDAQGELSNVNLTNIDLAGSWTKIINKNNLITVGGLLGYATRGFDSNSLTWDKQWNQVSSSFDASLPTGENFNTERISFLETALGLNYRWQRSKRTKLDLGIGAYHLFEPNAGFYDDAEVNLGRRISFTGIGKFQLAEKLDFQLNGLYQFQQDSNEAILSALIKPHLNNNRGRELELHLGLGWRSGKSFFPIVALQHRQYYVSLSYDIDYGDFSDSHDTPTSFEMHFNYFITDVKPKVKVCPIY